MISSNVWPRLFAACLGTIVGTGLYLIGVNRLLGFLRGGLPKLAFLALSGVIIVGGGGLFGFAVGGSGRVWALWLVFAILVAGEARRILLRRRYRGAPPVSCEGKRVSWRQPFTTTDLQVIQYEVPVPHWKKDQRLRVVHLSDLHVNKRVPMSYYRQTIERAQQARPDLVFITGDFISQVRYLPLLPEILSDLQGRLGIFAILGNHDYWAGAQVVVECITRLGIPLLYDGWQRLHTDEYGDILIVGCEIPWSAGRWKSPPIRQGELVLALAHSADNIYRLSQAGVQATFSGHYHAGQFQILGLGPLVVPSFYGRRFYEGHFVVNGKHLFVTAGVGLDWPGFRVYCPPDILVVDFVGSAG